MSRVKYTLKDFIESEKSGGLILIACTLISILLANSSIGQEYLSIWGFHLGSHSLGDWINDGLMVIFFLLIGLELVEEVHDGQLSNLRSALLPIAAAFGGMLVPAAIYMALNWGTPYSSGAGIPMATDIAFALGILSLLGNRVPMSLKIFLTALAVIDDLGAIIVIAIFYTSNFATGWFLGALGMFILLMLLNKVFKVKNLIPYILGGIVMWYCMLHSGIHATIAGVLLAVTIPYEKKTGASPCHKMQHALHYPVSLFILPIFALANTAIVIEGGWDKALGEPYAMGIILGLLIGKPLGITLFSFISVKSKLCYLPKGTKWQEIFGVSILGGIGFTMSIFITLLAFKGNEHIVNDAKLMILIASLFAGMLGYAFLHNVLKKKTK